MSNPKGKVTVYCAGGAGMNIGTLLEKHNGQDETGFATLQVVYVDTSKSNHRQHITADNSYILEGLDGSGKVRKENHAEISKHIRAILQKFQSTDLNIVLSATGGGSGSVIAPLIVSELLEENVPTVCIGIGGIESTLSAQNTLKTLKSYEAIAAARGTPIAMHYVQNKKVTSRDDPDPRIEADKSAIEMIFGLCVLFSRQNRELDSKDLAHWLLFDKVTTFKPQLVALSLIEKTDVFNDIGNIISVATLSQEGMSTSLPQTPEYQCVGYIPDGVNAPLESKVPMHFVTSDGIIPEAATYLNSVLTTLEQAQRARIRNTSILTNTDKPDQNTNLIL